MSDGIFWDQLFRNGQLVYKHSPEHREMLERMYAYYKNTAEIDVFKQHYPEFLAEMEAKEQPNKQAPHGDNPAPQDEAIVAPESSADAAASITAPDEPSDSAKPPKRRGGRRTTKNK